MLAAQVILAAVFLVAGAGKLMDLAGSRRALAGFGLSERTASIGGALLPLAELATAVALLVRPSARWGAVAALVLLLAFIAGIARAMSRGETPDCNCFGALHSAPAGPRALARNAALAAVATFVAIAGPGPSIADWVAQRTAAELVAVAAGIAAVALGALAAWTWWHNRRLSRELASAQQTVAAIPPGLPVGAMAPDFQVPSASGEPLALSSLLGRGLPVALVFVRPGCGPSEALVPELERWQEALVDRLTIGAVGTGGVARYRQSPQDRLVDAVEHDPGLQREIDELYELFAAYRLRATPSAVVLTPQGTIASATVDGAPAIEGLVRVTLTRTAPPVAPAVVKAPRPAAA